ncbi:hypothetical protein WJX81_004593 [Elliptochloris bilobata]|uniref:Mitochondrial fission 1 protein n=1 Tax=Elliptochloris bilobata TaxID=381761 RepID=A0AAW1RNE2_9CHLO
MELPQADHDLVYRSRKEFERLTQAGSADAPEACLRLVWALVHSTFETDIVRGRELAQGLLASKQLEERSEHDCIYLLSVALYRQGRLLDARRQLNELLKVNPESRQGAALKAAVEDQIVREGLVGVGVAGGIIATIAAVALAAAFGGRRR